MRKSRWVAIVATGVAAFASVPSFAAPPSVPTVGEVVAGVQRTYAGVQSVRADYVQTSKNPMTGLQEKSHGHIAVERPRKYRMDYGPLGLPFNAAVVSDGATQWIYSAAQKQVIIQKEIGAGGPLDLLINDLGRASEVFDVQLLPETQPPKPTITILLRPKQAGPFKTAELTVTPQKYVLQGLKLTDQADTVTDMTFSLVFLNGDVPDSEFTFKPPPGVTVVNMGGN